MFACIKHASSMTGLLKNPSQQQPQNAHLQGIHEQIKGSIANLQFLSSSTLHFLMETQARHLTFWQLWAPSLWFRSLLNVWHPLLYESKPWDLRPEVLFPRFTDVVAAATRGLVILINISKIIRKQRCQGSGEH